MTYFVFYKVRTNEYSTNRRHRQKKQGQTSILNLMFCLSFDKKQNNFLWKINKSKLTARAN